MQSPIARMARVLAVLAEKRAAGARPGCAGRRSRARGSLILERHSNHLSELEYQMAFDKDAFISALDSMSVMELNDLVKAIEEKFGVSAAAMAAPGGGGGGGGAAAAGGRRADRVHAHADRDRRQQGAGHQGGARADRPGPEGSQGPGRRAPKPVKEAMAKADAEAGKKKLEDAGAKAELK